MTNHQDYNLTPSKNGPMLRWYGKKSLDSAKPYPASLQELYHCEGSVDKQPTFSSFQNDKCNLLLHGDNIEVLSTLRANGFMGKIDLIYIDPPFDSKATYTKSVALRGDRKLFSKDDKGEGLSLDEQVQYSDMWQADSYLQFMYERLILLRELLSDQGSIYLHCDHHKSHHLRCLMDEVFGGDNFVNEIIWCYKSGGAGSGGFARKHDTILYYSKNSTPMFFPQQQKSYMKPWSGKNPAQTYYEDREGTYTLVNVKDWWDDIGMLSTDAHERLGYPTQKPEALLERVIKASSNPNSIVLDCFAGSGTTAAVAQKLGRRWIACDINKGAIQTTAKRLNGIIESQKQQLIHDVEPASYKMAHYKINNYDLQQQHNEFKDYVLGHYNITRDKKDTYFDGLMGERLVKLIPFNRIATLQDLSMLQEELRIRTKEARAIAMISYGTEYRLREGVVDHNKRNPLNRIDLIDIKLEDGLIEHTPAEMEVIIENETLTIRQYASPTVLQRLKKSAGDIEAIKLDNHLCQIDCVLIDLDYDDETFRPTLIDTPEKKTELVKGSYSVGNTGSTIAIKVVDVLGEEVFKVIKR